MEKTIQIKTKAELLEMGYENNNDLNDFLHVLAGRFVTLDLTKTIATKDGKIFICIEYPDYAIYDYMIKRVLDIKESQKIEDYEYTYKEIAAELGVTFQAVEKKIKSLLRKKLKNKVVTDMELIYYEDYIAATER